MAKSFIHASLVALSLVSAQPALAAGKTAEEKAAEADERRRLGSLYLRCDGQPDNMSGTESFARIMGAITLLGLFAKAPEAPDSSKRLFGEAGVDACTRLIDGTEGQKAEENGLRRVPLILGRAIHRIEMKEYAKALEDVTKARGEIAGLKLDSNPYFYRSMGLSADNIEAEAKLRLDDAAGAQEASLRRLDKFRYSFVPMVFAEDYGEFLHEFTPRAELQLDSMAHMSPGGLIGYADALEGAGRFKDAAAKRGATIKLLEGLKLEHAPSLPYARAALSHALAGEWEEATRRAEFARGNLAQRTAEGVAEDDAAKVIEILDLYDIVKAAHDGDVAGARRRFGARSQWISASFGAASEVNKRLREGAKAEDLVGALAKTPDQLWDERRSAVLATKLQKDSDNKTLFNLVVPYAQIGEFEARSKDTWRTDKSRMMGKEANAKTGLWAIFVWSWIPIQTRVDSMMLHAALQAKARGKQGFEVAVLSKDMDIMWIRFVNRDEAGSIPELFIEADPVIAELRQVIPTPEDVAARKKAIH